MSLLYYDGMGDMHFKDMYILICVTQNCPIVHPKVEIIPGDSQ